MKKSQGRIVEQIIRPTGLSDPPITVKPAKNQVDDLLEEIRKRVKKKERVLVTTLTKRMAEDLTEYYADLGIRVKYLHSDIDTLDRVEILRDLRLGKFDVLDRHQSPEGGPRPPGGFAGRHPGRGQRGFSPL